MTETFRCDDKDMLVAYLYGEIDAEGRREVERHMRTCVACAEELAGLRGVRQDLQSWLAPEPELGFTIVQKSAPTATVLRPSRWAGVGALPAWAQVAAAALVLAAGAAIANFQLRYDDNGLVVTTGWMTAAAPTPTVAAPAPSNDEWRPALVALEQNLRAEIRRQAEANAQSVAAPARAAANIDGPAILSRVQAMLDASEERQRQEIAMRLTQVNRDWNMQRQTDLMKINQSFGALQGRTFKTEAGQHELMNFIRRVSATQPIP
jgi:hypothetical protein